MSADLPASALLVSMAKRNPYARKLNKQITIRIDEPTIDYFRSIASVLSIPYQTVTNLYLRDCANFRLKLAIPWAAEHQD